MKSQGNITSRRSIAAVKGLLLAWLVAPVPAVAQNAYITNQGISPNFSNNVTVIDTTTNKVVTTINVGLAPSGATASPEGARPTSTVATTSFVDVSITVTVLEKFGNIPWFVM